MKKNSTTTPANNNTRTNSNISQEEILKIAHQIGHNLKQPLSLIKAYIYYLKKNQSEKSIEEYTKKIDQQVDVLTESLSKIATQLKQKSEG